MIDSKIKMIALDMDGTLLNDDKDVTEYTRTILSKAISEGVVVLPCTGRPANAIPKVVTNMEGIEYAISSNGARIVNLTDDIVIHEHLIETSNILKLLEIVERYDTYREVFWEGIGYSSHAMFASVSNYLTPYMSTYIRDTRTFVDDLDGYVVERNQACDKLHIAFADMDERQQAIKEIKALDDYELDAAMPMSIEITAPGVSKGIGIIKLGETLGIEKSEIMAIGDGMNDASMLREVGIPIAMGNAVEEIKALACYITDTNNDDGVAKAIKYFLWER